MKKCEACGAAKPANAPRCPACEQMDEEVVRLMIAGTPGLTLLIIVMGCFWIYRFWVVGWSAWTGNLRVAAYCAIALSLTAMFSPLWTFGIRNRKVALVVLLVGGIAFLFLNNL